MKLFHRKLIRFTSKANLGVALMAYRYFERYKCSRLISRLHGLTDNGTDNVLGTDSHVIIAWISQEENEDPKRPCVYERFVTRQR